MPVRPDLPRYDRLKTYQENYDQAPEPMPSVVAAVPGDWRYCGLKVASPLGIPAGPLLNGRWCLYYASLGFDVLTYKTVRSVPQACYELPNLQPVHCGQLGGGEQRLRAITTMQGSWAVSFGMPSQRPEIWRADIEQTRRQLPPGKILAVSVVGTVQPGWGIDQLAADYARCAKWAVESGADVVETNFSCPNVATCDGQLYQQAADSGLVAAQVRQAIGKTAYVVKIGRITEAEQAIQLLAALAPSVNALAMTNSIAATVQAADGQLMFQGQVRGICGDAIRQASIQQIQMMAGLIAQRQLAMQLIGGGGVGCVEHVQAYLAAGAHAVHLATALMVNPAIGIEIRRQFLPL